MKLDKIDPAKTRGLKVFMIGFLLAIAGFCIAALGAIDLGWVVILIGGLVGIFGIAWHFLLMFSPKSNGPDSN